MKKIIAGILALGFALVITGCVKPQSVKTVQTPSPPSPTPAPTAVADRENPMKLYLDQFSAACNTAMTAADAAAGEDNTFLPELLAAQSHIYALQKLLYGPTNLLYTSENLFDGGIYGLMHGTGSVWQTEEEISFSCTLSGGDVVTGTLKNGALDAKQSIETAAEEESEAPTEQVISLGKIAQRQNGWYSCCLAGEDQQCTMLYVGQDRLVFTRSASPELIHQNDWADIAPEQWGEMCLIAEADNVRLFERGAADDTATADDTGTTIENETNVTE